MTYHLIFSGNIRPGLSLFVDQPTRDLIEKQFRQRGLNGLILYTDGNFLLILEGKKESTLVTRKKFQAHDYISGIITLMEETRSDAIFDDLTFALCKSDVSNNIKNTLYLDQEKMEALLPTHRCSQLYQSSR